MIPIDLEFISAKGDGKKPQRIVTFSSYNFERNLLTPAAAFRFIAPGVERETRQAIRSGDQVNLWATNSKGTRLPVATGFIDETDTHIMPSAIEYVLTGRDTLGQLIDNDAIDAQNVKFTMSNVTLETIVKVLLENTRMPQGYVPQGNVPNGKFLFQTNAAETKMNALQRILEYSNCLVWTLPDGRMAVGKPNFAQTSSGILRLLKSGVGNNVLEARVRRAPNLAIRQIVTQLQNLQYADAGQYTKLNTDIDMSALASKKVGRSVYRIFSYGHGEDGANQVQNVGNQPGNPKSIGEEYSLREIARDNVKVLDVEIVVNGHVNQNDNIYNIDQIYNIQLEDDSVFEDMYVYSCSYELTLNFGMITRMRLCRIGAICHGVNAYNVGGVGNSQSQSGVIA